MTNPEKLAQVKKLLKPSENQPDRTPDSHALSLLTEVVCSLVKPESATAPAKAAAKAKAPAKDSGK
jgi:hypothetical protein